MEKILKVKDLLLAILQSSELHPAEKSFHLANLLMREAEGEILANACLNEETIAQVVQFNRGPLWQQAQTHLRKLQATYAF